MSDPESDPILERLRQGRQIVAPKDLLPRILEHAQPRPASGRQVLAAFAFGCASFVFTALLVERNCPVKPPATPGDARHDRAIDSSLALAMPWFATGRLDTSVSLDLEHHPELRLLEEARMLRLGSNR